MRVPYLDGDYKCILDTSNLLRTNQLGVFVGSAYTYGTVLGSTGTYASDM